MVSTPTPCLAMTRSRWAESSTSVVIESMPTIRASALGIRSISSLAGINRESDGRITSPAVSRIFHGSAEYRPSRGGGDQDGGHVGTSSAAQFGSTRTCLIARRK
jgi:hypothetical protein